MELSSNIDDIDGDLDIELSLNFDDVNVDDLDAQKQPDLELEAHDG